MGTATSELKYRGPSTGDADNGGGVCSTLRIVKGVSVSTLPTIALRPFRPSDRADVTSLLTDLPALYPKGAKWLQRRLDDVVENRARCTLAVCGSAILGATIETPKGTKQTKLSTIFVRPALRRRGVGSLLMEDCRRRWDLSDLDDVIVTVACTRLPEVTPLFVRTGFEMVAIEQARYGDERDEAVLRWCGSRRLTSSSDVDQAGTRQCNLQWRKMFRIQTVLRSDSCGFDSTTL